MFALFSPDSKIGMILSRIANLVVLNVLFVLTCIPVFTVGAADTALYSVCFRFSQGREGSIVKSYFRAFRDNFKQATILWLITALCITVICVDIYLCSIRTDALRYGMFVFLVFLVLTVMVAGYIFPLLSQFSNDTKTTLKNAVLLSIGYLPRSMVITAANVLPVVLMITVEPYVFMQAMILWAGLYFSAAAYLNATVLRKVFSPYMPKEEPPV